MFLFDLIVHIVWTNGSHYQNIYNYQISAHRLNITELIIPNKNAKESMKENMSIWINNLEKMLVNNIIFLYVSGD